MTLTFICTKPYPPAVYPGRHVQVIVESRSDVDQWILDHCVPFDGPVVDPFKRDVVAHQKEMAEAAAAWNVPPAPPLKRGEMKELLNTTDDHVLNFAMDSLRCPRARLAHDFGADILNPTATYELWDRREVENWLRDGKRVFGPIIANGTQKSKRFF